MKKILFFFLMLSLVLFLAPFHVLAAESYTIEFGNIETVYDWSSLKCDDADFADFPARALIDSDGNVQLYATHATNRKFIGPNLSSLTHQCNIIMDSTQNPLPRNYDDFEWLTSPYTLDGTTIFGLVHNEYHGYSHNNCTATNGFVNCWWNAINLAKSTDKGRTFTHSIPPAHNVSNTSIDFNPANTQGHIGIFQPSNIINKDGFYYAKVTVRTPGFPLIGTDSIMGICVMRTNNLNDASSWKFWDGAGFNTPARGIPASGKCKPVFEGDWDWHWSSYLNSYTSLFFVPKEGYDQTIQTSSDLTSVDPQKFIFRHPDPLASYMTFLQPGAETRNFEDIGRSPWLYYVTCDDGFDCRHSENAFKKNIKRIRVRFNKISDIGKFDVIDLRFNEYKGTKALDSAFYGNDGNLAGSANFVQEGNNKIIKLPNIPSSVTVQHAANLNLENEISIRFKIRTSQVPAAGTYPVILHKQGSKRHFGVYLTPEGKIHFSISNGTGLAGSVANKVINDYQWHDVVINFSDATGIVQYVIDGRLDTSGYQGGKLKDGINTAPLIIGADSYLGSLDQITIYNHLLPIPTTPTNTPITGDPPRPTISPTPPPVPGDLTDTGDSISDQVNIYDYNMLLSLFGNPYTIYEYNALLANFGN